MPSKKPNRIDALLGSAPAAKAPIARELGEEDTNPADMGGGGEPDEDSKKEVGGKLRAALDAKDDVAIYEAICSAYRLDSTGSMDKGGEDEEEPYAGSS